MDKNMEDWKDTRTPEQTEALHNLLLELKQLHPNSIVYGHKDFTDKKECPSYDAKEEYKLISDE